MKVLDGYKTFLAFKKSFEDWDAKKLSPSVPVDQMWHQHILDNRNYNKDCELLVGQVVYHDPDGGLDEDAREERIKTIIGALRIKFPDGYDEQVWNFGVIRRQDRDDRLVLMQQVRADSRSPSEDSIIIRLRDFQMGGEETFFKIKQSAQIGRIFAMYAERKGVCRETLSFLLDGENISTCGHLTPLDLQIDDQEVLDVMPVQSGC